MRMYSVHQHGRNYFIRMSLDVEWEEPGKYINIHITRFMVRTGSQSTERLVSMGRQSVFPDRRHRFDVGEQAWIKITTDNWIKTIKKDAP